MLALNHVFVALVAGGGLGAAIASWVRGRRRIALVDAIASEHGLSEASRRHLLTLFGHRLAGRAVDQIATVGTQRLLDALDDEEAAAEARAMRRLLFEFERPSGELALFDTLVLFDVHDADSPLEVRGWVTQLDEQVVHVVSRAPCPWDYGKELFARVGRRAFPVCMLMPPSRGDPTWILSHTLGTEGATRRAHERVRCRLEATLLPVTPELERLLESEPVPAWERLMRTRSWARRHAVTVIDISVEGLGLRATWDVRRGDAYFLVIVRGDAVRLVPRVEIMSVRRVGSGRLVAGARVRGTTVELRRRLAELVREVRAAAAAAASTRTLAVD